MRGIRGRLRYDTGGGRRKPIRGRDGARDNGAVAPK
jgi:hypothetical protein